MARRMFHQSLALPVEAVRDQFADKVAKVWDLFIGDQQSRTQLYKDFLVGLLKRNSCKRILDVGAGTGIDSVLLLEEGFQVVSTDGSDHMLKYARETRSARRSEPAFDRWIIQEANWLTLTDDIKEHIGDGFDAVMCLGNSFAHVLDSRGDQHDQKIALSNFERCVKPGGLLLIDHRNFDYILENGVPPSRRSLYYNCKHLTDIKTSIQYVNNAPSVVTIDYVLDTSNLQDKEGSQRIDDDRSKFTFYQYPHRLNVFTKMLDKTFPNSSEHIIYSDFRPLEEVEDPAYYIHVMKKAK